MLVLFYLLSFFFVLYLYTMHKYEEEAFCCEGIMTKKNFIQGAFILLLSSTIVRILGFIYQILIIRIIGTETIGLYNMVHPVFIMALVIATAGLPLAVSKLVSRQMAYQNIKASLKILRIAIYLLLILGITITIILLLIAPYILKSLYADPRVNWILYGMLPCITICSISSALRGFFQGLQQMTPTAITQCLEQITRIVVGLILVTKLQTYGIQAVAIGLAISMLAGELVGLIFLSILYFRKKQSITKLSGGQYYSDISTNMIVCDLFSFGIPTTFTRLISSISLTLEASLIPLTLQKIGFTINQAAAIYGQFSGVSMTILSVPTILTFSLAISLVPAISEAEAQGKLNSLQFRSSESLRLTFLLGLPAVVALLFMPTELSTLLFNIPEAGSTLRILGFGGIFLYLCQTSNGILQGLGLVNKIFINSTIGTLIKILGIIYLVSIPNLNINGAALGFTASYMVVCFLNLQVIKKSTGIEINQKQIFLPFLAAMIMSTTIIISNYFLSPMFSDNIVTLISLVFSGLVYIFLVILWGQLKFNILFSKKN